MPFRYDFGSIWDPFYFETRQEWNFWLKCRLQTGLTPHTHIYIYIYTYVYIYIYIYFHAVKSKLGPKITFFEPKLVFLFFVLFFLSSSICRENEIFTLKWTKRRQNYHFFESKLGPMLLRNILGPSFDSTLDQVLTQPFWHFWAHFSFYKRC